MSDFRKTARISPDRLIIGVGAITLVSLIMLASYVFSYTALQAAAVWTGVPLWATYLAPVFLDGALLTYSISRAVFKWRGEFRDANRTLLFLLLFTGISVAINAAHAASFWRWNFSNYETWFGILIGISAPIAALISAEEVVRLSFTHDSHLLGKVTEAEELERVEDSAPSATNSLPWVDEDQIYEPTPEYMPEPWYDRKTPPVSEQPKKTVPEFNLIFGEEN